VEDPTEMHHEGQQRRDSKTSPGKSYGYAILAGNGEEGTVRCLNTSQIYPKEALESVSWGNGMCLAADKNIE
jgi:hypothetical protein